MKKKQLLKAVLWQLVKFKVFFKGHRIDRQEYYL